MLKRLYHILIFLLLMRPTALTAQNTKLRLIDSLERLFSKSNDTLQRIQLLNKIATKYMTVKPAKGLQLAQTALSLSLKKGIQLEVARAHYAMGSNYFMQGRYLQAQYHYWNSLQLNEAIGNRKELKYNYHTLAMLFEIQANHKKAIEYYLTAIDLCKEFNDSLTLMGSLSNLADLYEGIGQNEKSLEYHLKSLNIAAATDNRRNTGYMMGKVGHAYTLVGNYRQAEDYLKRSISILNEFPDPDDVANFIVHLAENLIKQNNYPAAITAYQKAIRLTRKNNTDYSKNLLGSYYGALAFTYLEWEKKLRATKQSDTLEKFISDQAITYFNLGLITARTVHDQPTLSHCYEGLSQAYALKGMYKASLENYKLFILQRDSILDFEKKKAMDRQEAAYMFNKQKDSLEYKSKINESKLLKLSNEKKVAQLTIKQQWLYSIILSLVLVITITLFYFRNRTQHLKWKNELAREKNEQLVRQNELQQQINELTYTSIRSQMNPHFIFNALNTIQNYVYANDKKNAGNYLGKFSDLMRMILAHSNLQLIGLQEELDQLKVYMDLEKARFGEGLEIAIQKDPSVNTETIRVPPFIIQPYVENAIKHGLMHSHREKKLSLQIQPSAVPDYLEIIIDDNGIGRDRSSEINKNRKRHSSFAITANEKRINLLNQLYSKKASCTIQDKYNKDGSPAGTCVVLKIPLAIS